MPSAASVFFGTFAKARLGELDSGELERIERRLAEDGALRARAERLAQLVRQLGQLSDDAWEFVAAKPGTEEAPSGYLPAPRAAASREGAAEGGATTRPTARGRRWWQRRLVVRPALAATAAVILLAVGVGVGALLERAPGLSGATVTLSALPGAPQSASARARLTRDGRMLLSAHNLPASPPGTYYEAWLMTDTTRLVPIAAFRPGADGSAQIDVPLPAAPAAYRYIDISLQRASAGTAHSRDSVLRGNT